MGSKILIDIQKSFRRRGRSAAEGPRGDGPTIAAALSIGHLPITVLFGPSGCGKTTILRCIAGIETPDAGIIRSGPTTWFDSSLGINIRPQHRRIGFVFQEQSLFPHLTVRANIAYGLGRGYLGTPWRSSGYLGTPCRDRRGRVDELIDLFDLHTLQNRRPSQLSGGQRQRIALARALAPRPSLLLLDEPFASLDAPNREALRAELRSLILRSGTPTLIVTHDRSEALALGDEIAVMADGHILQRGPVQEVFNRPANAEIAAAVGVETVIAGQIVRTDDSLSDVLVGDATLTACNPLNYTGTVLICIRGEDVLLFRGSNHTPQMQSARNQLGARVNAVQPEGALTRIFLDCGFPLTALITRQACEELCLTPGAEVRALIKAPNVHLIPREPASINHSAEPHLAPVGASESTQ